MILRSKIKDIFQGNNAVVLMYHRIGTIPVDPWQLAVSESNFEDHLKVLTNEFNVMPIRELVGQIIKGRIKKRSVGITFDDGYCDNYLKAIPLLKQYSCPATFFISTGFINQQRLFWWDLLTEIFLHTYQLPAVLQIGELSFELDNNGLMTEEEFNFHKSWKWPAPALTKRSQIYLALWKNIKPLKTGEITALINSLIDWAGVNSIIDKDSVPMSDQQLSQLSSNELFSLGAHTVNHSAMAFQPHSSQYTELSDSRNYLLNRFKGYFNAVAYPYGSYNEETLELMRDQRFNAGFTTEAQTVNARSNIYQLGRFQVNNWTTTEFKDQLSKWLNK